MKTETDRTLSIALSLALVIGLLFGVLFYPNSISSSAALF